MTHRPGRVLVLAIGALLIDALAAAAGTTVPDVEAWLDRPLPTDAPAGTTIEIGAMLWDSETDAAIATSVFIRLHPGAGKAPPVETPTRQDWPGHVVAQVTVPAGGVGLLEIGTAGTACTATGCARSDALYAVAGVGPPLGAPMTTIATATIVPPAERVAAGTPAEFEIRVHPRAAWDPAAVPLPDSLLLQVRRPREPVIVEATARLVDAADGSYRATMTIPEAGTFVVQAATSDDDPAVGLFGGSAVSIAVEGADVATPGPDGGSAIPLVLAVVLGAGVVIVGAVLLVVARRADL